jgi:hypothetical protein
MHTVMRTALLVAIFLLVTGAGCHGGLRNLPVEGGMTADRSRVEPRLTRVASALIGTKVEVRCWSHRDWLELIEDKETGSPHEYAGTAGEGGPVDLAPEACRPLMPLLYTKWRPQRLDQEAEVAYAVGILAHELEHVRGEMAEQIAECRGMQRLAAVARRLGVTRGHARRLARVYWEVIYPDSHRGYRTRDCRDGGELDLRRRSSVWP